MQKGFAHLFLLIIVVLVIPVAAFFFFAKTQQNSTDSPKPIESTSANECDSLRFTHHFTDPETITSIIPPVFKNSRGTMQTMLINIDGKAPLYMPMDGKIVEGSYHLEQGTEFYMWEVDVGCGVTVVFDHVTEPIEKIKNLFPDTPKNHTRTDPFDQHLEMSAGDLVGYTTGSTNAHNWNFAVYDENEKNYLWESGKFNDRPKLYTQVCPFDYYEDSISRAYKELFIFSFNDIAVEQNICQS